MEIHDGLKLEAGNLCDGHRLICGLKSVGSIRITDVSYYEYALVEFSHNLACESCCRCLTVCACDGSEFSL